MAKRLGYPTIAWPFNIVWLVVMVAGIILFATTEPSSRYRGLSGMIVMLLFGIRVGPGLRIWDNDISDSSQRSDKHKQEPPCHHP